MRRKRTPPRFQVESLTKEITELPQELCPRYEYQSKIRNGGFAQIYLVRERSTSRQFALKEISVNPLKIRNLERFLLSELQLCSTLRHPHILPCVDHAWTSDSLFLVLELAEWGNLKQFVYEFSPDREVRFFLFSQILEAVRFLHLNRVLHRDLKLDNMLMVTNFVCKLSDFGWAVDLKLCKSGKPSDRAGTLSHMAPEVYLARPHEIPSDVWGLGVSFYELMFERLPFFSFDQAYRGVYSLPANVCVKSRRVIERSLIVNASRRGSVAEILKIVAEKVYTAIIRDSFVSSFHTILPATPVYVRRRFYSVFSCMEDYSSRVSKRYEICQQKIRQALKSTKRSNHEMSQNMQKDLMQFFNLLNECLSVPPDDYHGISKLTKQSQIIECITCQHDTDSYIHKLGTRFISLIEKKRSAVLDYLAASGRFLPNFYRHTESSSCERDTQSHAVVASTTTMTKTTTCTEENHDTSNRTIVTNPPTHVTYSSGLRPASSQQSLYYYTPQQACRPVYVADHSIPPRLQALPQTYFKPFHSSYTPPSLIYSRPSSSVVQQNLGSATPVVVSRYTTTTTTNPVNPVPRYISLADQRTERRTERSDSYGGCHEENDSFLNPEGNRVHRRILTTTRTLLQNIIMPTQESKTLSESKHENEILQNLEKPVRLEVVLDRDKVQIRDLANSTGDVKNLDALTRHVHEAFTSRESELVEEVVEVRDSWTQVSSQLETKVEEHEDTCHHEYEYTTSENYVMKPELKA